MCCHAQLLTVQLPLLSPSSVLGISPTAAGLLSCSHASFIELSKFTLILGTVTSDEAAAEHTGLHTHSSSEMPPR